MSALLRALKTTGIAAAWVAILVFVAWTAPPYAHPFVLVGSTVLTVIAVDMAFSFVTLVVFGLQNAVVSFAQHRSPFHGWKQTNGATNRRGTKP